MRPIHPHCADGVVLTEWSSEGDDMADIHQQIWDADQSGNGLQAIDSDTVGDEATGFVRVASGPASEELRILSQVVIPAHKQRTYDLVRRLFDNYALSEAEHEVETQEERDEVHELRKPSSNDAWSSGAASGSAAGWDRQPKK